jgi:cytochrome c553
MKDILSTLPFLPDCFFIYWLRSVSARARRCGRVLNWRDGSYDFDHRDNNSANNSQRNCYLVCKVCHGKHTVVKKRRITNMLGQTIGYETIKKKVGYKKTKKKTSRKRASKKKRGR